MKKLGILIFAAALVIGLVASNLFSFGRLGGNLFNFSVNFGSGVHGSGNVVKEDRSAAGFKSIETSGIFQVIVVAQKDFAVEVEADDNLMPLIKTEVRDGVLQIESEQHFKSSDPVIIRVSAPDIEKVDVSGISNVNLSNVNNTGLTVSGSGASKITLSGETSKLNIDVSGATKINADELRATNAVIDASGASQINVNVSNEINSDLSGACKVVYAGSPSSVVTRKSGVSRISAK
ncbi:MAG: head GIN domain-containing protein [Acidobacteriota bacterium]